MMANWYLGEIILIRGSEDRELNLLRSLPRLIHNLPHKRTFILTLLSYLALDPVARGVPLEGTAVKLLCYSI